MVFLELPYQLILWLPTVVTLGIHLPESYSQGPRKVYTLFKGVLYYIRFTTRPIRGRVLIDARILFGET